jgi:hypothetical protein
MSNFMKQDLFLKLNTTNMPTSPLRSPQKVELLSTLKPLHVTNKVELGSSLRILSQGGRYKLSETQPQAWESPGKAWPSSGWIHRSKKHNRGHQ